MKNINICFCGAQGTGKSTLQNLVVTRLRDIFGLDRVFKSLSLARIQREGDHSLGKSALNQLLLELLIDNQSNVFKDKILVASRSVIDRYANSKVAGLFKLPLGRELLDYYEYNRIPQQLSTYDILVYVPIRFKLEADGVRNAKESVQRDVDRTITSTLKRFAKNVIVGVDLDNNKIVDKIVAETLTILSRKSKDSTIEVSYKLTHPNSKKPLMTYEKDGQGATACFDLYAVEDVCIPARSSKMISCGIKFELPLFTELLIRGRSGLARKGLQAHLGTVDSNYRGECGPILFNHTEKDYNIRVGDRVCQVAVRKIPKVVLNERKKLTETSRGLKGFGSSGF